MFNAAPTILMKMESAVPKPTRLPIIRTALPPTTAVMIVPIRLLSFKNIVVSAQLPAYNTQAIAVVNAWLRCVFRPAEKFTANGNMAATALNTVIAIPEAVHMSAACIMVIRKAQQLPIIVRVARIHQRFLARVL